VNAPALTPRARAHLKALAHPIEPVVMVGAEGITDAIARAVSVGLEDHELIKVRLGQNFVGDRDEAAAALAAACGAAVVQVIGRIVVLYRRRSRDLPKRPRIVLPTQAAR